MSIYNRCLEMPEKQRSERRQGELIPEILALAKFATIRRLEALFRTCRALAPDGLGQFIHFENLHGALLAANNIVSGKPHRIRVFQTASGVFVD